MLPHGRDGHSNAPSSGHRPVSDKEEIARAALRSLAEPTAGATSDEPLPSNPGPSRISERPLPPPSRLSYPPASGSASRSSFQTIHPHEARLSFADPHATWSRSIGRDDHLATARDGSDSSFFRDQSLNASPESSPRLRASSARHPVPQPHPQGRRSLPSGPISDQVHEAALRRASWALRLDYEDVRHIVHRTARPHTGNESAYERQVLDAYRFEAERASQPSASYQSRATDTSHASVDVHPTERQVASSGMVWSATARRAAPPAPSTPFSPNSDRSSLVAWGTRPTTRLPTFQPRLVESTFQQTPYHGPAIATCATSTADVSSLHRPPSPSPFAYDAYRRTSHPVASRSELAPPHSIGSSRASIGSFDQVAQRHPIDQDLDASRRTRQPYPTHVGPPRLAHDAAYEHHFAPKDTYAEHPAQPYPQRSRQRRGSMIGQPEAAPGPLDQHDDRLLDHSTRTTFVQSYQTYPTQPSRPLIHPSAIQTATAPIESPQLSPTTPEHHRFQHLSALRSPAAETAASVASSSTASIAAFSPSPLLGAASAVLAGSRSEARPGELDADSDAVNSVRAASEDTASESTRARVASMHLDDGKAQDAPKPTLSKSQSLRSSFSHADRRSTSFLATDLSHSQIMQKLQDKVKSRLAAKGKAAFASERSSGNSHKGRKALASSTPADGDSGVGSTSGSKKIGLGRAGSAKRSASNISKSDPIGSVASNAAKSQDVDSNSPPRTTTTAEKSASDKSAAPRAGLPAAKVRRTSTASQQKPDPKPPAIPTAKSDGPPPTIEAALLAAPPKPPSPPQRDNDTPNSIEAALLSPTDGPTPTEAAAQHAQRLSRSPLPPENAVESASGQAVPSTLPAAGQMMAASATKQQTSKAGADSLIQAAQSDDPTENTSAIA
ncbi:hypothetical protein PHSY_000576 [Pseudozyma hubeiensis SY62]|uniref:Uncharacterized protein n=1 Tax=Pseudozyma hubeiensis (strain SY62) TaxID=1305764 RepID=R9P4I6_PSEHS|nr:hypothetical protein PHSY_000576 [Pseudozyma hubeiensis SY62]GAC93015.1 hypothetical protein PHSY_000576 [Pseudozyma hubeiensis SY62]